MSSLIYERLWPDYFISSLQYSKFKVYLNSCINYTVGATKNTGHRNSEYGPTTTAHICEVPAMGLLGHILVTSFQL